MFATTSAESMTLLGDPDKGFLNHVLRVFPGPGMPEGETVEPIRREFVQSSKGCDISLGKLLKQSLPTLRRRTGPSLAAG